MARITKANEALAEQFGFVIETPPEKVSTRTSKYDELWEASKTFLMSVPGTTIRVKTYTNASAAYADAKKINNSEHRHFTDGDQWTAVATKSTEVDEDGVELFGLWLTYNGE